MMSDDGPRVYQAMVIKAGLKLYHNHKIMPNRDYTPAAMMAMATLITNKKFKPRDYSGAIKELERWIEERTL